MIHPLDYSQPAAWRKLKILSVLGVAGILWPLVIGAILYGEWLLAWCVLGHVPRASLDDPGQIPGSRWISPITALALFSAPPGVCIAISLLVAEVTFNRPSRKQIILRTTALVVLWAALFLALKLDPGGVLYWWFD